MSAWDGLDPNRATGNGNFIEGEGKNIDLLKKNLSQNDNILRHLFVKVENHQELPTKLKNEKK